MWKPILKGLSQKGLIRNDTIANIDKSCCTSTQVVLDFDFAKEEVCKLLKISTPKSADCLYYNKNNNSLYFIEMKDLTSTMEEIRNKGFIDTADINEFLAIKLDSFKIHDKIFDSYMTSLLLLSAIGTKPSDYKKYLNRENLKIHFILLVKASSSDYLKYRLSILGLLKRYSFRAFSTPQVNLIRSDDLDMFISQLNAPPSI